jgi:hypothetical protein
MAGRPPLRIGQHGKITRKNLGGGVWMARTRFRDNDGVTRIVERRGPADDYDKHGKLAEDALIEALVQRRAAGDNVRPVPVLHPEARPPPSCSRVGVISNCAANPGHEPSPAAA